jgi:hypothetical protein
MWDEYHIIACQPEIEYITIILYVKKMSFWYHTPESKLKYDDHEVGTQSSYL